MGIQVAQCLFSIFDRRQSWAMSTGQLARCCRSSTHSRMGSRHSMFQVAGAVQIGTRVCLYDLYLGVFRCFAGTVSFRFSFTLRTVALMVMPSAFHFLYLLLYITRVISFRRLPFGSMPHSQWRNVLRSTLLVLLVRHALISWVQQVPFSPICLPAL